jgi:peptide chain release factor 3
MKMEQERGISVTVSRAAVRVRGLQVNLLDTPGHEDFSEDTYRTLMAADSAVMLLDNRKGVEEQTRKLFEVCRMRRTPIFTFVNKCDRPAPIRSSCWTTWSASWGSKCYPMTWPITRRRPLPGRVRPRRRAHPPLRARRGPRRSARRGARPSRSTIPIGEVPGAEAHARSCATTGAARHGGGHPFSREAFLAGELSPGVLRQRAHQLRRRAVPPQFLELAPPPAPRESHRLVDPADDPEFTGFVFKIQANMDPKHRDRIAFVRVCSGRFEAGMQVKHVRTGKPMRLSGPQQFMARERTASRRRGPAT